MRNTYRRRTKPYCPIPRALAPPLHHSHCLNLPTFTNHASNVPHLCTSHWHLQSESKTLQFQCSHSPRGVPLLRGSSRCQGKSVLCLDQRRLFGYQLHLVREGGERVICLQEVPISVQSFIMKCTLSPCVFLYIVPLRILVHCSLCSLRLTTTNFHELGGGRSGS